MGSQYYSNEYGAMDGKMALSRLNFEGNMDANDMKAIANKDKQYDKALAQGRLNYLVGDAMYDQEQALKKRWAKGFEVFA